MWFVKIFEYLYSPKNVEMFTFYARLCTDQICSRVDCEKSNDRIYSTLVSNKTPGISASLKLWYLIVSQLVLEIFKNFMKNFTLKKVYFLSIRTWFHAFPIFFQTARISTILKIWWWNWYDIPCMDGIWFPKHFM